jgi:endonuclease III
MTDVADATRAKPKAASARMPNKNVRPFLEALDAHWPDAKTELVYADVYTLLVSVVLSAQATDVSVNRATGPLFEVAATPQAMVDLGVEGLGRYIKSIGLWQGKARNVVALSQTLIDSYGGEVPHDREALEALPGVGRKTANVVLNVAFGEPTIAVDTHLFRLGNRTGLAPGTTPRAVEDQLLKRIPPDMLMHAHHWLILHGRYICKARLPECWRCNAAPWCAFKPKSLPPTEKRPSPKPRGRMTAIAIEEG